MIDYAEALTVIDVNSGSFVGRGKQARLEDTITKTNLEAADEVVRQLRLRDIGGIIVIDFIDMAKARNRDAVLKMLRGALEQDRTKTFTAEISKLGLVEMTRQNVTEGVREIMTRAPARPATATASCSARRRSRSSSSASCASSPRARRADVEAFLVQMNPRVSAEFTGLGARMLHELEESTGKLFHFEGSRGPAARPLRDHDGGQHGGGRRARRPVPRGRRGARHDRRAAHVQRRRRRRQDRRVHRVGRRRRAVRRARSTSCASRRRAAPRHAPRSWPARATRDATASRAPPRSSIRMPGRPRRRPWTAMP